MADVSDPVTTALDAYVPGTRAWFPDKELGWISGTLTAKPIRTESGEISMQFDIDGLDATKHVKTTESLLRAKGAEELLPPLRNPPLLETTDDLTSLSYLNEPAGE